MPIRHCQKCGLKVLIDENQAATNPFYCQRCTTSLRTDKAPEPKPPTARSASGGGSKPGTVKVQCPYCKATFNGRIPQKPARGACPVCQKELILLPNGDIQPSTGFDPLKWQREQAPPPAAPEESPAESVPQEEEAPPPAPAAPGGIEMPSWMDEPGTEPAAPPAPPEEAPEPEPSGEAVIRNIESMPDEAEAPPAEEPAPEEPAPEEPPPPPEPADEEPPTPPPSPAPPPPRPVPAAKRPLAAAAGRGTARRSFDPAAPVPTGPGKIILALFMMAVPVIACPILYNGRGGLKGPVEKIGARFGKGFHTLYTMMVTPPRKAKTAPPPEKKEVVEEPVKPGPEDQKRDEEEINKLWIEYMREKRTVDQKAVGASASEQEMIRKAKDELQKKLDAITERRERYRNLYGKDYDPQNQ